MNEQNNKPRILIFSFAFWPWVGGAEVAIQKICKKLADDFEFDLVTFNFSKKWHNRRLFSEQVGNINVHRVGSNDLGYLSRFILFYPWLACLEARRLQKEHKYDLVWSIMAMWAGWAGLIFKEKNKKIPWLLTMQSGDDEKFLWLRTWFWFFRYKQIYQKPDKIQVISRWLEVRGRKYGFDKEIVTVPNGVDIDEYEQPADKNKTKEIKNKFNIKKEDKIIFTTSRLVKKNAIDVLVKAFALVVRDEENIKLMIAGDGKQRKKIRQLINGNKIQDKVVMLGHIEHEELRYYYQMANLFVRPSLSEGMGNSFIEAMAAGVPVIGTAVGGIVDFLEDKQTGYVCRVKDTKHLAKKIIYVLSGENDHEVEEVVERAQKKIKQNYNWDKVASQMKDVFDGMIQRAKHE